MVEEMLLERGIMGSYETIRRWGKTFGPQYARRLYRKQPSHDDIWYLDEVAIMIASEQHWLWRRRRPRRICARRDRPAPPQRQGRQAIVDAPLEETGCCAEAHDHRPGCAPTERRSAK
jgi:hypothetical protein